MQHRHTGKWCTRSRIGTSAAVAGLLQLFCSCCSCVAASAHRQLVDTLNTISRSPASKEADTGGGRNGHDARQSFADLQAAVPVSLFADAAGDARHAASTCSHKHAFSCRANPGSSVCVGGVCDTIYAYASLRQRVFLTVDRIGKRAHTQARTHMRAHINTHTHTRTCMYTYVYNI